MEHITTARELFRETLTELGIHAEQIQDGFELEPTGSYHTIPGVYSPARTIPALTNAFRLFRVKYAAPNTLRYTHNPRFCGSDITRDLIDTLDTTDPAVAATYIRDLHARASTFLNTNRIDSSPQNVGTLMALATYCCPGHNSGTIAALPHCSGDVAYRDVYLPFLRANATLTDIVTACAERIGTHHPVSYIMTTTPVRYGVLNLRAHEHTLATIKLGIYGD